MLLTVHKDLPKSSVRKFNEYLRDLFRKQNCV